MANSTRTVWLARTAGWFEFDPTEGLVAVDKHDPRVLQAKKLEQNFLIGNDLATIVDPAQAAEITRLSAELTRINELLEKAEAALLAAKNMPQADPAEVADLTTKLEEAKKALADYKKSVEESAKKIKDDNDALVAGKDKEISELKQKLKDEPRVAFEEIGMVKKAYQDHPKVAWTVTGALLVLLLLIIGFAAYGVHMFSIPAQTEVTEVTKAPADDGSIKKDLADLKAKQKSREEAEAELAAGLKKLPSFVPLKTIE